MTAAAIAEGCSFPPRFLYRILRRLVDAGLLTGVSGPGGGYTLARRSRSINLLDVVAAIDGPPEASKLAPVCPRHREAMKLINAASAHVAMRAAQELSKVTLDKLGQATTAKRSGGKTAASKRAASRRTTEKPAGKGEAAKAAKTTATSRGAAKGPPRSAPRKKKTKAARTSAVE